MGLIKYLKYMYLLMIWTHKVNSLYHELNEYRMSDRYYPYADRINLLIDSHEKAIRKIKELYRPTLRVTYRRAA